MNDSLPTMIPAARAPASTLQRLGKLLRTAQEFEDRPAAPRISTGCRPLDEALPEHGFVRGSLVEWLADGAACGATSLALVAAREAQRDGGAVAIVDPAGEFYAPAAAAWGLDLAGTLVVRPRGDRDAVWAFDQLLRSPHIAAVVAWPRRLDGRTFRRLQLAAESSGAIGLLIRPAEVRRQPSWAGVRLLVQPRPSPATGAEENRRLAVELLRSRGRFAADERRLELEIDARTGDIHEASSRPLAAELAHPAPRREQA